jgi:hypothetical protein
VATKVYKKMTTTKKKKKKPPSIKSFFPTLRNSQGFGMHFCRYEEKIGDHVLQYPRLHIHSTFHRYNIRVGIP